MYSLLNITPEPITKHPQQATPPTMTSQPGDWRLSKLGQPAPEKEQLSCPRCQSTNTKFCYYNNYNLSQPRHFCKSCRRYWTRGGALRDVPVGGGTRNKSSNKRRRCSTTTTATATTTTTTTNTNNTHTDDETRTLCPEESAWWSGQMGTGCGLLPLNGNEYGLDYGLGGMDWPLSVGGGSGSAECDTWQLGGGEGRGVAEGDYFSWLELAMSTPANALK